MQLPYCAADVRALLLVGYAITAFTVLARPIRDDDPTTSYRAVQAMSVGVLGALALCRRSSFDLAVALFLCACLALRASGSWSGGRWDSLLASAGMILSLMDSFVAAMPSWLPHKHLLFVVFAFMALPALGSIPSLVSQPSVDARDLLRALDYCELAYELDTSKDAHPNTWFVHDSATDTTAGVTRELLPDGSFDVYVCFAGTQSKRNWLTNFDVVPKRSDWCGVSSLVHAGFSDAYDSVEKQVTNAVRDQQKAGSIRRVIVTGHSLGGALAVLCAAHLSCEISELAPVVRVVTFGAPAVGDATFAKAFKSKVPNCVRVSNPYDPIPKTLSGQFIQVGGVYLVSLVRESPSNVHDASTYRAAILSPRALQILAIFGPPLYLALPVGLGLAWRYSRTL